MYARLRSAHFTTSRISPKLDPQVGNNIVASVLLEVTWCEAGQPLEVTVFGYVKRDIAARHDLSGSLKNHPFNALGREIVAKYKRENPMKAYGDIRSPLPLDAPAYLDGTMTRVEIVSESLWS